LIDVTPWRGMQQMLNDDSTALCKTHYLEEYQKSLLPIKIIQTHPNNQGSADLQLIGEGDNSKDYAIKQVADSAKGHLPATELFCYELAARINIPTPNYDIVMLKDGTLAFGSEWEGVSSIKDSADVIEYLTGNKPVKNFKMFLSKVFAFDLFINNVDRHLGNILFRNSYSGTIALAFDYGRAWYEIDAFGYQATSPKYKTKIANSIIKNFKQYDKDIALETLKKLSNIPVTAIERILCTIPTDWFSSAHRKEITSWWGSDEMKARLTKLEAEV
jgi:hypothetical protein